MYGWIFAKHMLHRAYVLFSTVVPLQRPVIHICGYLDTGKAGFLDVLRALDPEVLPVVVASFFGFCGGKILFLCRVFSG